MSYQVKFEVCRAQLFHVLLINPGKLDAMLIFFSTRRKTLVLFYFEVFQLIGGVCLQK